MFSTIYHSPLGPLLLVEEGEALSHLYFPGEGGPARAETTPRSPLLCEAEGQLAAYFAGKLEAFSLPLGPVGTPFQQKVWGTLATIPYGKTWSYRQLAQAVDCPQGARAVGGANGKNPLPILLPCHRVISAQGGLGGYSGGLERKKHLLSLEGVSL